MVVGEAGPDADTRCRASSGFALVTVAEPAAVELVVGRSACCPGVSCQTRQLAFWLWSIVIGLHDLEYV
jgi:hypothetical protein